jgi:hypothetical protein
MKRFFHFCEYSKWSQPVETYNTHKQQWRVCNHCNRAQFRTLGWDRQAPLTAILAALNALKEQS